MKWSTFRKISIATVAGIAIAAMFALACYSLYLDRTATAGVAAAMTLALILVRQLNLLESFEILSLKAKFTARIGEADQLLTHIRRSASVSAKWSNVQLAFMNRMGDIGWPRKRELLEEVDGLLRDLSVPESEISQMKAPFLNLVSLDLSRVFEHSVSELLKPKREEVQAAIQSQFSKGIAGDPELVRLHEERGRLEYQPRKWDDPLGNAELRHLRAVLIPWVAAFPLQPAEREIADLILNEVTALSEACWRAGTITKEAQHYLDLYGSRTSSRLSALNAGS